MKMERTDSKASNQSSFASRRLVILLALALIANVALMLRQNTDYLPLLGKNMIKSGQWRSANYAFSQRAANFYQFLNSVIPTEADVLIPNPDQAPQAFSRTDMAQFFLWPRHIQNCPGNYMECAAALAAKAQSALVITDLADFQSSIPEGPGELLAFDEQWGVLLPQQAGRTAPWQDFAGYLDLLLTLLLAGLFITAVTLPGAFLVWRYFPDFTFPFLLSMAFGLGTGTLSLLLTLFLLPGGSLSPLLITATLGFYWLLAALIARRLPRLTEPFHIRVHWQQLVLLLPALAALILAIGLAYTRTDEIVLWGAKGLGIAAAGLNQGASDWGTLTTRYPLNLPMLIASFRILLSERLPEAKLLFPLFYLGLMFVIYEYLTQFASRNASLLGALLLGTSPLLFLHSRLAYANLPASFYLVAGTLWLFEPGFSRMAFPRTKTLAFCLLSLAAWTRPEGQPLAWTLFGLYVMLNWKTVWLAPRAWLAPALPLLAFSLIWSLAARSIYSTAGFFNSAFASMINNLLRGNFHFGQIQYILQFLAAEFFNPSVWGASGYLLLILALALQFRTSFSSPQLLWAAGLLLLPILGLYFAASYLEGTAFDLSGWATTGLSRLTIPAILVFSIDILRRSLSRWALLPPGRTANARQ